MICRCLSVNNTIKYQQSLQSIADKNTALSHSQRTRPAKRQDVQGAELGGGRAVTQGHKRRRQKPLRAQSTEPLERNVPEAQDVVTIHAAFQELTKQLSAVCSGGLWTSATESFFLFSFPSRRFVCTFRIAIYSSVPAGIRPISDPNGLDITWVHTYLF